jgi:hypothetical protein
MSVHRIICAATVLLAATLQVAGAATLPPPVDGLWPAPPPGWDVHPGGGTLPDWTDAPASTAPAVTSQHDPTFPGETTTLLGAGLAEAGYLVWTESGIVAIEALRRGEDRAQVTLPGRAPRWGGGGDMALARSVTLLWPRVDAMIGSPIRINAPTCYWSWPRSKTHAAADRSIRIFGKSLSLPRREPIVVAQREGDAPFALTVLSSDAYEIVADLPIGYQPGDYRVWVHNGSGGRLGWSDSLAFAIVVRSYDTSREFHVDEQAGDDDRTRILNAVRAADDAGGGSVLFSAREYTLAQGFDLPSSQSGSSPVVLRGAGSGQTVLRHAGAGDGTGIRLVGPGSGVRDMSLDRIGLSVRANDMHIHAVDVFAADVAFSTWIDEMPGGRNAGQDIHTVVTDSTFRSDDTVAQISGGTDLRFARCTFIGSYGARPTDDDNVDNHGITSRDFHRLIVEDCHFRSHDAPGGTIMTRGFASLRSWDRHHVLRGNTFEWIGAFPGPPLRDLNTGEIILYHGGVGVTRIATVVASGWDHVTVDVPSAELPQDRDIVDEVMVFVQDGAAKGQVRPVRAVAAVGETGTRFSVPRWQHRVPEVGAQVLVADFNREVMVLDNHIDAVPDPDAVTVDFNRAGVQLWKSAADFQIANNRILHTTEGVRFNVAFAGTVAQVRHNVVGNRIRDMLPGSAYGGYPKFYTDGGNGRTAGNSWLHAVGSVFRGNVASGAEIGVEVGANGYDRIKYPRKDDDYQVDDQGGILGTIVEDNVLHDISVAAYAISTRSNWTLLRGNEVRAANDLVFYREDLVHQLLRSEDGDRIAPSRIVIFGPLPDGWVWHSEDHAPFDSSSLTFPVAPSGSRFRPVPAGAGDG